MPRYFNTQSPNNPNERGQTQEIRAAKGRAIRETKLFVGDRMRVLIACEESQSVCLEFRAKGHEAFSCDVLDCSGGRPEYHIKGDVLEIIQDNWDLMIGFPPCTHLAVSGAAWFEEKIKDGRQQEGIDFFMALVNAPIKRIAIENPVGVMSSQYRKPDQTIQPYYFGDPFEKRTHLWLKNLPLLFHSGAPDLFNDKVTHVEHEERYYWIDSKTGKKKSQPAWYATASQKGGERGKRRSKTFLGIARAMADQWG